MQILFFLSKASLLIIGNFKIPSMKRISQFLKNFKRKSYIPDYIIIPSQITIIKSKKIR